MLGICFYFGRLRGYCTFDSTLIFLLYLRHKGMPMLLEFLQMFSWQLTDNIFIG